MTKQKSDQTSLIWSSLKLSDPTLSRDLHFMIPVASNRSTEILVFGGFNIKDWFTIDATTGHVLQRQTFKKMYKNAKCDN